MLTGIQLIETVLANEQVVDGKGWRSGAIVERKKLNQWFFNISKFSEDLLQGLDSIRKLAQQSKGDAKKLDR